ncbi:MAG: hypothetical protein ACI4HN_08845 [Ruminococcus sp.]
MENHSDFCNRIKYQQAEFDAENKYFQPNNRVYEKINENNQFKNFYGDTVVFDLDSETKKKVSEKIEKLYSEVSECFSQRLDESTIHMTLHDLSASDNLDSVAGQVFHNEISLLKVLEENPIQPQTIRMRTNFAINMINISLVLALVPADEAEWNKLQALYSLVDKVMVCPYPYLTPHITLAYYNYNGFDENSLQKLRAVVSELNRQSFEVTLDTNKLFYQKFVSMNEYIPVFKCVL